MNKKTASGYAKKLSFPIVLAIALGSTVTAIVRAQTVGPLLPPHQKTFAASPVEQAAINGLRAEYKLLDERSGVVMAAILTTSQCRLTDKARSRSRILLQLEAGRKNKVAKTKSPKQSCRKKRSRGHPRLRA